MQFASKQAPAQDVDKLIEYREAHYSASSEASHYVTNTPAQVQFTFGNPIICRLTHGVKRMRVGGSKVFRFDVGDVMYVPQNTTIDVDLSAASVAAPVECDCFEIETDKFHAGIDRVNAALANRQMPYSFSMDWNQFAIMDTEIARNLRLDTLMELFRDQSDVFAEARIDTGITDAILALFQSHERSLLRKTPTDTADTGIGAAARAIRDNLDRHLPNSELAALACMSESTLQRRFLSTYGQSPSRFAQIERVRAAKSMLRQSDRSIDQIASDTGFSCSSHFGRVFRKHTGETPATFRRNRRSGLRLV